MMAEENPFSKELKRRNDQLKKLGADFRGGLGQFGRNLRDIATHPGQAMADASRGFSQGFDMSRLDYIDALKVIREREGKAEPPRHVIIGATHPIVDALRQDATINPEGIAARIPFITPFNDNTLAFRANHGMNVGSEQTPRIKYYQTDDGNMRPRQDSKQAYLDRAQQIPLAQRLGHATGSVVNDFTNNATRNIWWLLNASQAITDVATEAGVQAANPEFFMEEEIPLDLAKKEGLVHYSKPVITDDQVKARRHQLLDNADTNEFGGRALIQLSPTEKAMLTERAKRDLKKDHERAGSSYRRANPGIRVTADGRVMRRRFNPNHIQLAAMLPAAIGVNAGIGLLNREDGYTAAVPDELDPRQTANAVMEVGSRYLLGREGRLMEADDFLLERPDVTYGEYQAYRNYLRDRELDFNLLDDGKMNFGVGKVNLDGIRGAEVQFLGKSLGLNDTIIPTVSAAAGSVLGATLARNPNLSRRQKLASLAAGGLGGLALGTGTGDLLENNRRRSNFEERNPGVDYDTYKRNAGKLLENKMELIKAVPNAEEEKSKSKTGFSKRQQQEALLNEALKQQTLIDQLVNEERKQRAVNADDERQLALDRFIEIENSFEN